MLRSFSLFLLMAATFSSPVKAGQSYLYSFRVIYKDLNECQQMAADLASNFKQLTGIDVVNAACSPVTDSKSSADLVITYIADTSANIRTQWFGMDAGPFERPNSRLRQPTVGIYKDAAECQADTAAKVAEYGRETHRAVLGAHCSFATTTGVTLRIDGIGSGGKKLQILDVSVRGLLRENFVNELKANVAAHPGVTVSASLFEMERINIFYYAAEPVPTRLIRGMGGALKSKADCDTMAAATVDILKADGERASFYECLAIDENTADALYFTNFVVEGQTLDVVLSTYHGPQYANFASCMQDRSRIIDIYRNQGAFDAVGALCGLEYPENEQGMQMTLYGLANWRP